MKVLVTGAAGNLGSCTCRELAAASVEVVATDRMDRKDLPVPIHVADLLDKDAVHPLTRGVDAVVHLGNHIDFFPFDPYLIFGDNVRMNLNVFQAAADYGVRKIIFASSIQVIGSVPRLPDNRVEQPAYLPLDSDNPAFPTNPYALSKQTGEVMLQYYARVYGIDTIAVRLPGMRSESDPLPSADAWESDLPQLLAHAFSSYLTFTDVARLLHAILTADLPGHRIYLPVPRQNILGQAPPEIIDQYYPNVPLHKSIEEIDNLVDLSRIKEETGWSPAE